MLNINMYINGKWVPASRGKMFPVYNPSTKQVIAQCAAGDREDVDKAVKAARRAFESGPWHDMTALSRSRLLFGLVDLLRKNKESFARWESINNGKPISESVWDIEDVITCFEYYAGLATKVHGETFSVPDNAVSMTLKEPMGVCGQIVPWNYPLLMAAWKLAPALAAGCTCVIKPASWTPVTLDMLTKLFAKAGFPPGVVNAVYGSGSVVGNAIAEHMDIDKVAATGSVSMGRSILEKAGTSNLKKVTLELGGKSPNIVFADADFDAAVEGAMFGLFLNQGEMCSAGSRVLVEQSLYDKFLKALVAKTKKIRLGPSLDKKTQMGPVVSEERWKAVLGAIKTGKQEGARCVLGGGVPKGASYKKGWFVQPTIFAAVKNSMRIAQEEIFGPVIVVLPFRDEAEAIRIANDVRYGLAGAVWTKDIFKAFRVAKAIRAGILWINSSQPTYVEAPWGGYKQSGHGRELSIYGLEEYLETKQVHVNLNEGPVGWY